MKNVSIIIRLVLCVALIITSVVIWKQNEGVSTAFAVGDLTVDWGVPEGSPIFVVNNMIPGNTQLRSVLVTNSGSFARPVSVRGLMDFETKAFSSVLLMTISENGTDIYNGTLQNFIAESSTPTGLPLSTVPSGTPTSYDFTVTFPTSADDDFQNASVQFDLKIGIDVPLPSECSHIKFSGEPIYGTAGKDRIHGTNKNDLIFALEGNDTVDASNGDDCIVGGPGNDRLDGSNGKDIIFGGDGNDKLDGSNGNDKLYGEGGVDYAHGSNGRDTCDAERKTSCEL